jgi:hypothetical protein
VDAPDDSDGLSTATIAAADDVDRVIPAMRSMLSSTDADRLLTDYPPAVQRLESSEWRSVPGGGAAFAADVSRRLNRLETAVQIIKPSSGTYTLASSNSPLPLTVHNGLDVPVTVRIAVSTVTNLPGFRASDPGRQIVNPGANLTLHVPTDVQRTGRFQVQAMLLSPNGTEIGAPVYLSIRSTALGVIGVIITIVAGVVLALALLFRAVRRLRHRSRQRAQSSVPELV